MKKLFIPPVFLFLTAALVVIAFFLFPEFSIIPFPYNFAGVLVAVPGIALMGITRSLFKKHNTTLFIEKSSGIIKEGPFCRTRNPMYCGMFLLLFGFTFCFGNWICLLIPFLFVLIICVFFVPVEENLMKKTFGEEYLNYKKSVRRWI